MQPRSAAAARPGDPGDMQELNQAEQALSGALERLLAVAEAYPELKANETMSQLSEELTTTENRIAFARQAYNDAVTRYNTAREIFPGSIVAGSFQFGRAELLERAACGAATQEQKETLSAQQSPALTVLSALAELGHGDPFECRAAYAQAMGALGLDSQREPLPWHAWTSSMGESLQTLAGLAPREKAKLLEAAAETMIHDGRVTLHEGELLRAMAAAIGCPVPNLGAVAA